MQLVSPYMEVSSTWHLLPSFLYNMFFPVCVEKVREPGHKAKEYVHVKDLLSLSSHHTQWLKLSLYLVWLHVPS